MKLVIRHGVLPVAASHVMTFIQAEGHLVIRVPCWEAVLSEPGCNATRRVLLTARCLRPGLEPGGWWWLVGSGILWHPVAFNTYITHLWNLTPWSLSQWTNIVLLVGFPRLEKEFHKTTTPSIEQLIGTYHEL